MKTSSKTLFMTAMVLSTLMVISSTTWINMWIGLEINLMSFIPMMMTSKNYLLSQGKMTYFLIQSMASMLFLTTILINKYMFTIMDKSMFKNLLLITMMMKMGMPPFHMWLPEVMNKMSWFMCLLLMTWQKIAPMYIMSMMIEMNSTILFIICLSAMTGAIAGLNQTSTRKIMAYSSITHMGWLVSCAMVYKKAWMMYLLMYSLLMLTLCMMMYEYNIMFINQMNIFLMKKTDKIIIILMILSLGGLPPFLGFIPKWITMQYMVYSKEMLVMFIMMMSALVTMFYYLRMSSSINLIMNYSQKWMYMYSSNKKIFKYMFYSNMMLPILIMLLNFY